MVVAVVEGGVSFRPGSMTACSCCLSLQFTSVLQVIQLCFYKSNKSNETLLVAAKY